MPSNYKPHIILVTGGCGFIGTNLVEYLLGKGHQLRILDNLFSNASLWSTDRKTKDGHRLSDISLMVGDIRDREKVEESIEGVNTVVHLAAHTDVVTSNPKEDWDVNVNGTLILLEACRRRGLERFIFASSNAVVGEQAPPIDETIVPQPLSLYGASKLAGEALCSAYYHSFGLKTTSLRFANGYGPYSEHRPSVISKFVKSAKDGKPLIIYGDGNQTRDFVHASDICQAIYLALAASDNQSITPHAYGEVIQIASGVETSIKELAEMMKKITESNLQIKYQPVRKGEIERNYSDISKAKAILSFEPRIELRDGLEKLWQSS
ncbi:NAD-dependent epimerase/dehydratase family protein [Chloroflexota bacterium]